MILHVECADQSSARGEIRQTDRQREVERVSSMISTEARKHSCSHSLPDMHTVEKEFQSGGRSQRSALILSSTKPLASQVR